MFFGVGGLFGDTADAFPSVWPARGLRTRRDGDIESKLGSYAFDTATPITKGSWSAAHAAGKITRPLRFDGEKAGLH